MKDKKPRGRPKKERDFLYNFEAVTPSDYKLYLELYTSNAVLKRIFRLSKPALKMRGLNPQGDIDGVDEFTIIPQYYKLMRTALRMVITVVRKEVSPDIEIFTYDVIKSKFVRDEHIKNQWNIRIWLEGTYLDKR